MKSPALFRSSAGRRRKRSARRGAMVLLIALCLPIFICMAIFAVDVAYMELSRTELRAATDFAARAGGRKLSLTQNPVPAVQEAKTAALKNYISGEGLLLDDLDIEVGTADRPNTSVRYTFTAGGPNPNAIRITGKRTAGSLSGPVNLFFARFLGHTYFEPVQVAVSSQVDRDIALILDRSGSMCYAVDEDYTAYWPPAAAPEGWDNDDLPPPGARWHDLTAAVDAFFTALNATPQDEIVSLGTFNATGMHHLNLTSNYTTISDALAGMNCEGMTAVGLGIQEGINALAGQTRLAAKTIVVMTDGIHNEGIDPETVAATAASQGITVHTITYSNQADQVKMQAVATAGNGQHWHAPTAAELVTVFQIIANSNPTLLVE